MSKVIGVIPARFGSTRFPGKLLHPILGRPLIDWVIEAVKTSRRLNEVLVATDHERIAERAQKNGVRFILTSPDCPSGSDRVWSAIREVSCDLVVNIQGDEPLLKGEMIDELIKNFSESGVEMGTMVRQLNSQDLQNINVVKAILNCRNEAIYFSRCPIPYTRQAIPEKIEACWQHLGIYIYKKEFLKDFCETPSPLIEQAESLEQLRALWLGAKIHATVTDYVSVGVDTPDDVLKVEALLNRTQKKENI